MTLQNVEQAIQWDQAVEDYNTNPVDFTTHSGFQKVIPIFTCPSDPEVNELHFTHDNLLVASTSFVGVNGLNFENEDGVFFRESGTRFRDITDGLSHTLMIGERPPSSDFWYGWWYAGFGQSGSGSPDMVLGVNEINLEASFLEDCGQGPFDFRRGSQQLCDTLHFWSYHSGGANFSFVDGSVRYMAYTDGIVLQALSTRAGAEIAEERL